MPPWSLVVAQRGARRHARLVALVLVVQVVAVALASAFPALLAATEQGGVREALAGASGTGITIVADRPTGTVARSVDAAGRAVDRLLGDAAHPSPAVVSATSVLGEGAGPRGTARPYLGEVPVGTIRVASGAWPSTSTAAGVVAVAVPRSAASSLGVAVGSTLPLEVDGTAVRTRVAAFYDAVDRGGETWSADLLSGAGEDPQHVDPAKPYGALIDVVGPVLVPAGTIDRLGVTPSRVTTTSVPSFTATTVAGSEALAGRLGSIDQIVAVDAGSAAENVTARTRISQAVDGVLAQVLITRSVAAVAGLLLVVLAVAVLLQAALLLDAARDAERELLVARGATRSQLVGLATWEAVGTAVVDVALGVPLGAVVASVVRGAPTPPAAGSWAAGVAVALVIVAVRLLPRLRNEERATGRQARTTGLMRAGGDLVLVALAAVLGWQLVVRRVDPTAGIDPVLVAAPAALVLAGALVAVRLVPVVGRVGEVAAARSRGAVGGLVGWEVSRRSSRAVAAVLLVVLAVATGAFGAIGEATWLQSQRDQAALAVGAPVRVPASGASAAQAALLARGAAGTPQPSLRRPADVGQRGAGTQDSTAALSSATVLGLTPTARAMLERGPRAGEGGAAVERLRADRSPAVGVALSGAGLTLRAVVRVGDASTPIAGAEVAVRAVLEGGGDLLTTIALGSAPVDGAPHGVGARLPASGLRLVGFQLDVLVADPTRYRGNEAGLLPLRVLRVESGDAAVALPAGWTTSGATGDLRRRLQIPIEEDLRENPVSATVLGWAPVTGVRSVWTRGLVDEVQAEQGGLYAIVVGGTTVPCELTAVTTRVPGSGAGPASAPAADVVVVDQLALTRFLVQSGDAQPLADQWWVDVAPDRADAYLAAHRSSGGRGADGAVALAERLSTGPLRLATTQTLHLLLVAAAALGLLGFGVDVAATLGARRREAAQLRAIGLRRGVLERLLAVEATARAALGALVGVVLGIGLGALAAPRLVVGQDGGRPVPSPVVVLPTVELLVLAVGLVVVAGVGALLIVRTSRGLDPAGILREGDA
ncbi:FtsX-like permease family protein [Amnibacterium kyonggiense]|uniref:FtsX-like permease family protein n=1 Tax=Amnibacterium kyonggiense TaxID=595671 RepID=A0A4R7FHP1_9MICO|nr:FtsX-like permease family protein [Amnibacterium kyonggiense]TDS75824.1 FtsX-like permease family protein [Amnibacterium kyonggiense]